MAVINLIISIINLIVLGGVVAYLTLFHKNKPPYEKKDPYENYRNEDGLLSMKAVKEGKSHG
jgi:hypothetical protein